MIIRLCSQKEYFHQKWKSNEFYKRSDYLFKARLNVKNHLLLHGGQQRCSPVLWENTHSDPIRFSPTQGMALFVDKPKQTPTPQYSNLLTLSLYALHSNTSLCGFVAAQGKRIFRFNDHILTQNSEF